MLCLDLGHLAAGEIKDLFAEQLEDDHVVLTEALARATRPDNVADEGGPVLGPLLFQDLYTRGIHMQYVGVTVTFATVTQNNNPFSPKSGMCPSF